MLFDYIAGPSQLRFFKELWAIPTTRIEDGDSTEVKQTKLAKRLQYLAAIAEGINQPWFKMLEEVLMGQVKQNDNAIHEAVLRQDQVAAVRIAGERTGIVTLFESLHAVDEEMRKTREMMAELDSGDDPRTQIEESLHA